MKGNKARLAAAAAVLTAITTLVLRPAGAQTQFTNPTPIALFGPGVEGPPPPTAGAPYPSDIVVSGLVGSVTDVNVILNGFDCSSQSSDFAYPEDVDMLLVGPTGADAVVLSDVGGANQQGALQFTNLTITLDDEASSPLPADTRIMGSGTYRPTDDDDDPDERVAGYLDLFDPPAPAPTGSSALSVFDGTGPNGTWSLYAVDDWPNPDNCTVRAGWTIEVSTTADPSTTSSPTTAGPTTTQPSTTTSSTTPNRPPNAVNDTYSTPMNTPLVVPAPGVLGNDSDPDGDPLTSGMPSSPANGGLSLSSTGGFTYTPNTGFTGVNTFTYMAHDPSGGMTMATVTITVTGATAVRSRGTYFPLPPARILDTRVGVGAPAAPVGPGSVLNFVVTGTGGVPATDVSAVVLNMTVVSPTAASYMTVWPTGEAMPTASNLNYVAGQTVPNLVKAKVGVGGQVSVFNAAGSVHVLADVAGWYKAGASNPEGARFTSVTPSRILDTRTGTGAPAATVGPGATLNVQVTGQGGVPATGVSAVAMNVTAVVPTAPSSYLTAWPTGEVRPTASNLNYVAGAVVPNLVIVKVGSGGQVSLYNDSGQTHVLADVVGWYSTPGGAGSVYEPLTPSRVLDTRTGSGAPVGPVGAGSTTVLQVTGRGGVPGTGVTAVALNITAVGPTAASYLTAWPTGEARPTASSLNYSAGQVVPNLVVVKVGAGGAVSLYNDAGQTHVLADVVGWFGPDPPG